MSRPNGAAMAAVALVAVAQAAEDAKTKLEQLAKGLPAHHPVREYGITPTRPGEEP